MVKIFRLLSKHETSKLKALLWTLLLPLIFSGCTSIAGYSVRINLDTEFSPVAVYVYESLEDMTVDSNLIHEAFLPQDYFQFESPVEYTTLFIDMRFSNGTSNWHKPKLLSVDQTNISSGGTSMQQRIIKQRIFSISDKDLSAPAHTHFCLTGVDANAKPNGLTWVVGEIESPDGTNLISNRDWNFILDDEFTFYRPTLFKHRVGRSLKNEEEETILSNYPTGIFGTYQVNVIDSISYLETQFDLSSGISDKSYQIKESRLGRIVLRMKHPNLSEAIITLRQKD